MDLKMVYKKYWLIATWFAILYSALSIIILVIRTYHPMPWHDEWAVIRSVRAWDEGTPLLQLLFANHNEHRIFFPRLFYFVDFYYFGGRSIFTLLSNLLIVGLVAFLFYHLAKQKDKNSKIISLGAALLILGGHQASNFIWAFQIQWTLFCLFATLTFILFFYSAKENIPNKWPVSFIAICTAFIAGFCTASGTVLWVVILMFVALPRLGLSWVMRGIWAFAFVAYIVLYWHGLHLSGTGNDGFHQALIHPFRFLTYFITYLGGPISQFGLPSGIIGGICFLGLSSYRVKVFLRSDSSDYREWVCVAIIIFVWLNGGAVSIGRNSLGFGQAIESIYSTVVLLGYAATWILHCRQSATLSASIQRILLPTSTFILLAISFVGWWVLPYDYLPLPTLKSLAASAAATGAYSAPELKVVGFNVKDIADIEFLRRHGRSFFSDVGTLSVGRNIKDIFSQYRGECNGAVDSIELSNDKTYYTFKGWAYDYHNHIAPKTLLIVNEAGSVIGVGNSFELRPDVSAYTHNEIPDLKVGWKGFAKLDGQSVTVYAVVDNATRLCLVSGRLSLKTKTSQ
jgi:hypothetical protein